MAHRHVRGIMCPAMIRWESPTHPSWCGKRSQNPIEFRILRVSAQRRAQTSRALKARRCQQRAPIARPPDVGMAHRHVRGIMAPQIRMGVAHHPSVWKTKCQNFRIPEFQNFRISEFQNFRISEFHGCRRSGGLEISEHTRAREGKVSRARPPRGLRMSGWRIGTFAASCARNDPMGVAHSPVLVWKTKVKISVFPFPAKRRVKISDFVLTGVGKRGRRLEQTCRRMATPTGSRDVQALRGSTGARSAAAV